MRTRRRSLHPAWWSLLLLAFIVAIIFVTFALFAGLFRSYVPVTMLSDRSGLVMETGGKVKMRGVVVGRVAEINGGRNPVSLRLDIDPLQIPNIPANVQARIRATTAFGAKYVDLSSPPDPSPQRISSGAVLRSENVSTEVNTVFENLTSVLHEIDPAKLNAVLTAFAEGLRGKAPAIGAATTAADHVLTQLTMRPDVIRRDWQSLKDFSDTYSAAAGNILDVLNAASTTSATLTDDAASLDQLLVTVVGLSNSGIDLLGPSKDNLIAGVNSLETTTRLLKKYNPEYTCMLLGAKLLLDPQSQGGYGWPDTAGGGDGKSTVLDVGLLLGDDIYKYPDNLPVVGAKGGPGGAPGCGSLPDVSKNFPQRYLVTNTGWGTGLDVRPNPGIGFPGYVDYLPSTRAVPQPPSMRYPGGPAPGPIPYPGAPPYGAPMYGSDGTPVYPGLPPAPPAGAPRDPGPTPGSEPFTVPDPMQLQPTPVPPLPTPAVPAP